jgi:hypothetical protein
MLWRVWRVESWEWGFCIGERMLRELVRINVGCKAYFLVVSLFFKENLLSFILAHWEVSVFCVSIKFLQSIVAILHSWIHLSKVERLELFRILFFQIVVFEYAFPHKLRCIQAHIRHECRVQTTLLVLIFWSSTTGAVGRLRKRLQNLRRWFCALICHNFK